MNYSLENVEKFVEDNSSIIGDRADGILERASSLAIRGIISKSSTYEIMQDNFLTEEFNLTVFFNGDHIKIGAAVIAKNAEEDRENALSNDKIKAVFELIIEAEKFLREDFGLISEKRKETYNGTFELRCGCFEALRALSVAIKEELDKIDKDKRESQLVIDGLICASFRLATHYGVSLNDVIDNSVLLCGSETELADKFF